MRSLESVTWLPAGDLQHPPLPSLVPAPSIYSDFISPLGPIHQHFITLLSLRTESLVSPVFVCSSPNILCFSIAPSKSLALAVSLVLRLALQSYIFFVFILSISVFYRDPSFSIIFVLCASFFSLRCLFVRTYFLSSHSSEALIFFSDSPLNLIPPSRIPIQNERVPSGTSTQTLPLLLFSVIRSIKEKCVV